MLPPTETDELPEPVPAAFDSLAAHLKAWPIVPTPCISAWTGPRAVVSSDREPITPSHDESRKVTPDGDTAPSWAEVRGYHAVTA